MTAYYNEHDQFAAAWLRELIKAGMIAPGEVDERSIEDVVPTELAGFTQCHFFAGIGAWSYALRQAGWSDSRPVWTGSCPCQPFSAAGKGAGFADERHLWPSFFWLIEQCRPPILLGEQVASKAVEPWIDLVQADLEAVGYAFGCVPFPAAGVGAPHLRDRAYWVADAQSFGSRPGLRDNESLEQRGGVVADNSGYERLGNTEGDGRQQRRPEPGGQERIATTGSSFGMADAYQPGLQPWKRDDQAERYWHTVAAKSVNDRYRSAGPTNGHWRDVDWLFCRDGKWRPVESIDVEMADELADSMGYCRIEGRYSLSPLIQKGENRVGRLRGYGNAIVAAQATEIIRAFIIETERRNGKC